MSIINLFLQKRRMRESQHGIIMVIAAYVLSILMLVMGSDVFYNISSSAAGINNTTEEETQEKINKELPDLQSADATALLIQSKLQNPFGIAEVTETGLKSSGTAVASGSRTAALGYMSADSNPKQDREDREVNSLGSVSSVLSMDVTSIGQLSGVLTMEGEESFASAVTAPLAPIKNDAKEKEDEVYSLSAETTDTYILDVTKDEIKMLERIVQAEAGGEDMTGKILIANVIMNRVTDEHFPDTIEEVIFQNKDGEYQFSPIADERYWSVKISGKTKEAVERALEGEDYSEGALYFIARKRTNSSSAAWFDNNLNWLFKHGGHEFYK